MARNKAHRLDINQLREALRDGKLWTALGVVRTFPGESTYWEIDPDGDGVSVDVELVPRGERIFARLASGSGGGVWTIPAEGSEVAVLIPDGEMEADPIIVAVVSDPPASLTDNTQTVVYAPGTIKVVAPAVEIDASDSAKTTSPDVEIDASSSAKIVSPSIELSDGTPGAQPTFLAVSFMSALATLLTAIVTGIDGAANTPTDPTHAISALVGTAVTTFASAVSAGGQTLVTTVK